MKRILSVIIVFIITVSFAACDETKTLSSDKKPNKNQSSVSTTVETKPSNESSASEQPGAESKVESIVSYVTSEITVKKPNSNLPKNLDRSWQDNPAALCFPISGEYDDEAGEMRAQILASNKQSVEIKGTTYYVSQNGSSKNDGKSPDKAWSSIDDVKANKGILMAGDAVLFERGGVFRGSLKLTNGVYYGAYGTGEKPCIYGSKANYAKTKFSDRGNNIWRLDQTFAGDIGLVVFNHGEAVGNRKSRKELLTQNFDFYNDESLGNILYLYYDKDPTEIFLSIEIGYDTRIFDFDNCRDITIENLTFKYTGGHAVRGSNTQNISVLNCEFGYIGGSILNNYGDGTVRYGNAIELMSSSKNTLIDSCVIYQVYDSGITHQGDNCTVENFTARNCLIEYCGMGSIEYWHTRGSTMNNILYENNMMRFAGYGFGGLQRPDKNMSAHIQSNGKPTGAGYNDAANFNIRNNIFDLSTYQLINITNIAGQTPVLKANTYVQVSGKWLGYYKDITNIKFNSGTESIIKNTWGDNEAKLIYK